jgi:hypothetical protein
MYADKDRLDALTERVPGAEHTAHCIDYLRASGRIICVLDNFQKPKAERKRIVDRFPDPQAD